MQPSKQPRGFTVGAGVELFGIAVAILGVTVPFSTGGPTTTGNPIIAGMGAFIVLVGLVMHVARV